MGNRVYLDWNASAPLRPEAKSAMLAAMDVLGNPSSVHTEGRAAKSIIEKAREQVAHLVQCQPSEIIFTSGATEAIAMVMNHTPWDSIAFADSEHDAVRRNGHKHSEMRQLKVDANGQAVAEENEHDLIVLGGANSETGVIQPVNEFEAVATGDLMCDATQIVGKTSLPWAAVCGDVGTLGYIACSSHKIGGPKGVGALVERGVSSISWIKGGGQESNRRAGTENLIGIAGFGAAAEAAANDLKNNKWDDVAKLRDAWERDLKSFAPEAVIFGQSSDRLPNTSYFAIPNMRAETAVMQLDLAGFAVSAGSACSSGKVKPSHVLRAMGCSDAEAIAAIRVSIGPTTTHDEMQRFGTAFQTLYQKWTSRQAA